MIVNLIVRRRQEAREMGKLIHPLPFFSEFRERFGVSNILVVRRLGDFVEEIAIDLRSTAIWRSYLESVIVNTLLSMFM